jgi:hypothetical protein
MSVHAQARTISSAGLRAAVGRCPVAAPVLITALIYLAILGPQLSGAHGNPDVFIQFGRLLKTTIHAPAGAPIGPGWGYDGQLYWLQAADPLLRHPSTIAGLAQVSPAYSLQRVAYPAFAWLLAAGRDSELGWSLLAVNLLAVLGLTAAFSVYARGRAWNPAWALVIGLSPGLLLATSRDLSDVLAATCMMGGLMCWRSQHPWRAAALLTVSVLSREPMALVVAAVGIELAVRCVRALPSWTQAAALLRRGLPVVVIPTAAYLAWRAYASGLPLPHPHGAGASAASITDRPLFPPFNDFWVAARAAIQHGPGPAAFVLPYLALTAAAVVVSVGLLRRGPSAPVVTAVLYGCLVLPVIFLTDQLALTRYTMPLFLALLLAGLEQRSRPALAICAGSTAMLALLPLIGT